MLLAILKADNKYNSNKQIYKKNETTFLDGGQLHPFLELFIPSMYFMKKALTNCHVY